MKLFLAAFAAVLAGSFASAQANRDDLTPLDISYTTTVSEDRESFLVEMVVDQVQRPTLHLAMPAWTPGAYGIGHYGDGVRDLTVHGEQAAELGVTRMNQDTWSVDTAGHTHLHVSYSVSASRRGRFGPPARGDSGPVTGLRLSAPRTYLYVRGAKDRPVTSRYVVPEDWRVANGLLPTEDPDVRYARDYDTFIDAPTTFGIYEERTFEVNGTPFSCVFFENAQEYDFDIDAFVDIVRRIVTNIGELYGSYPFRNYVFLFSLPGGGGLEHLNSTTVGLRAESQKRDPEAGASVTAHEFFHAWNVKRIRPVSLGPFDYQRENYTGNLWVSEGWTSYFGDLTLVRTGIIDQDEYLALVQRIVGRELNKDRRKEHSVYWSSRNTWHRFRDEDGSRVDYYGKGELLAAMIDLKIRHETDNRMSLNDVMRFMNRWFAERGVGFEETDVERTCTAISNYDFGEFFARHVRGTLDPPLAEYFAYAGIEYTEELIPCSFPFPLRGNRVSGRRGGEPEEAPSGPRPGDRIVAVDDAAFESANAFLREHAPGDVVTVTLTRGDEEHEVEVTLGDDPTMIPTLAFRGDATEEQLRIREGWLTSVR
ncbi:MAG: M61 family metallopeptidase [bacterium]|nr:M61 family metallopeptidase [bacterium]